MSSLAPFAGGPGMATADIARPNLIARMAPATIAASAPRLAQGAFAMPAPRHRIGDPAPGATTLREDCVALGAWCLTLALAGVAAGWLVLS